jgi:intein/homing endonuclease
MTKLTNFEITYILNDIKHNACIPLDTSTSIVDNIKNDLKKQLSQVNITCTPNKRESFIDVLKTQITHFYEKSQIEPGSMPGVIAGQSIGQPVTQSTLNSLDWTEEILYTHHNTVFVEPIGQMIDKLLSEHKEQITMYQEKETEYLELPDGYYIPSGDENGMNEWLKIEAVTRHLPCGKLVKVTTQSGRTVKASQSKSFLVWDGDKFVPTNGCDVKVGDILPTTKQLPRYNVETQYLDLKTIFPMTEYIYSEEIVKARVLRSQTKFWFQSNGKEFTIPYSRCDSVFPKSKGRKEFYLQVEPGFVYLKDGPIVSHIPDKIPLDNDFGFVLGIYLADGCVSDTFVCITKKDKLIRQRVTDWCDRWSTTYRTRENKSVNVIHGTSIHLTIHSVMLARMFKRLCDTGSSNKYVPYFAYTAPRDFIKGLIDGYLSGDGWVCKTSGNITVGSVSQKLLHGISFLLTYFGIFSKLSGHQQLENNVGSKNIKYMYNLSILNGFAQTFAREIPLTEPRKQARLQEITLTKKYIHECGRSQQHFPHDRNIYFDEIVSIEEVDCTTQYVYDFTIDKTRNFNVFSGLTCLDSFHYSGCASARDLIMGVKKFLEILNATQNSKATSCTIYYPLEHSQTIKDLRKCIGNSLVCVLLNDVIESYKIIYNMQEIAHEERWWYSSFQMLNNVKFYRWCVRFLLDKSKLFKFKLTPQDIVNKLEVFEDISYIYSPLDDGVIDVFVKTSHLEIPSKSKVNFSKSKNSIKEYVYITDLIIPKLKGQQVAGIKNITEMYFAKDDKLNCWYIETEGTNLNDIIHIQPEITGTLPLFNKLESNDMWEIYKLYGIEATRTFLIQEITKFIGFDGTYIDHHHVELLVDMMTWDGTITSVSRYGIDRNVGPLAKASFEESMDNLLKAGLFSENESSIGVSASIMLGKSTNIGSNSFSLVLNTDMLIKKNVPTTHIDDYITNDMNYIYNLQQLNKTTTTIRTDNQCTSSILNFHNINKTTELNCVNENIPDIPREPFTMDMNNTPEIKGIKQTTKAIDLFKFSLYSNEQYSQITPYRGDKALYPKLNVPKSKIVNKKPHNKDNNIMKVNVLERVPDLYK